MAYRIILGTKNWSSWSLRPWLALRATGVPFEEVVIQLAGSSGHDTFEGKTRDPAVVKAEILKYSPSGKVPALEIEENGACSVVFDSLAICETLAERHPEAGLWPKDPEARGYARAISACMHSSYGELRSTLSMDFARKVATPALSDAVKAQIGEITGFWQHALDCYGHREFLFGAFSIADCMYAPVVSRFRTYGIALPPVLAAYSERIFALTAMRDWEKAAIAEVAAGLA